MNRIAYVEDSLEKDHMELHKSLIILGDDIIFNENNWICNRIKKGKCEKNKDFTIYFNNVPTKYLELVKYYAIIRAKHKKSITTIIGDVARIKVFLNFFNDKFRELNLANINEIISNKFKIYLDNVYDNPSSKYSIWESTKIFFNTLKGWPEINIINPFRTNPYEKVEKLDDKLIPEYIANKLDVIFLDERIPLYQRLMYWILRLIPSRVGGVCDMEIECLKPFNGHHVIFIPNNKGDEGYKENPMRSIHLEYSDIGKYLIDLIREQQLVAEKLQDDIKNKNLLFTYNVASFDGNKYKKTGEILYNEQSVVSCADKGAVNRFLERICTVFDIRDNNGNLYLVNSHQFRHNGITDRIQMGFTPEQIRFMTDHGDYGSIFDSYNHMDLRPKALQEFQKKVIDKRNSENKPIYFRGRILNLEDTVAERILKNVRAHKVRGGLCSDITNCRSKVFACLDCEYQIDDVEDLPYFEEQVVLWQEKMNKFKDYPDMYKIAKYNYKLHLQHKNNIISYLTEVVEHA